MRAAWSAATLASRSSNNEGLRAPRHWQNRNGRPQPAVDDWAKWSPSEIDVLRAMAYLQFLVYTKNWYSARNLRAGRSVNPKSRKGADTATCKMCGVVHRNLGKGTAARPRCIPTQWRSIGIEPHRTTETSAVSSVQERRSCPSRNPPRPSASPLDHDQRRLRSPLDPMTEGVCRPWNPAPG